jgi:hypothetical protein
LVQNEFDLSKDAWTFFLDISSDIGKKYTPIKKMRIKNRFSPWFKNDLQRYST